MEVKIKLENGCENFCPKKAHPDDAGYDLYSRIDAVLEPLSGIAIPVGFAMELPRGYEAQIRPRSGFSAKGMEATLPDGNVVRVDADVILGTIDETYRGNVGVIIKSYEKEPFVVAKGTRIAQMVISECYMGTLEIAEELNETERGEGGFGHTGTK